MTRRRKTLAPLVASILLAVGAPMAAQARPEKPSRYILKDLGTFGGPNSFVTNSPDPLNDQGTVVGSADTPNPDPFDPFCLLDCFEGHAFQWRYGVLTDLGSLASGASSTPNAINAHGVVVGISETGAIDPASDFPPEVRAVVWKNGRIIDLGTFGGTYSYANAINDRGQVVGFAMNPTPEPYLLEECGFGLLTPTQMRAFIWEAGALQELGTLGGSDSCAMMINKRGEVAGNSFTSSTPNPGTGVPTQDPFFWKNGTMTDLGSLGGTHGHVSAMNDHGQICGDSNLEGDETQHGFLWDRGTLSDLTPESLFSVAEAINEWGDVAGGAFDADGTVVEGYRWSHGVLDALNGLPDDGCSVANAINAKGQAVGNSFTCVGEFTRHAVLWDRPGPAIDLNTVVPHGSGLTLTSAVSINDAGEITGQAVLESGEEHAYLLIPRDRQVDGSSLIHAASADAAPGSTVTERRATTRDEKAMLRARLAHALGAPGHRRSK